MSINRFQSWTINQRRIFNPSNKEDLKLVRNFLNTNRWGSSGCPFYLEWPFEDIPYMLKTKITEDYLKGLK